MPFFLLAFVGSVILSAVWWVLADLCGEWLSDAYCLVGFSHAYDDVSVMAHVILAFWAARLFFCAVDVTQNGMVLASVLYVRALCAIALGMF